VEPVEQRARRERGRRQLLLDTRIDRRRRARVERLLDPEDRRKRFAQPEPGGRQREEVHVVGEHLPHRAVVNVVLPDPDALEWHALRVEHPPDVVVGCDEETAGRVESCRGVGEEPHVDVPVRADDRQLGNALVEVEAECRGLDVAVGS